MSKEKFTGRDTDQAMREGADQTDDSLEALINKAVKKDPSLGGRQEARGPLHDEILRLQEQAEDEEDQRITEKAREANQ